MKTLAAFRSGLKESVKIAEAETITEAAKNQKDPPPTLLLKRKAIRVFPNGRRIALYFSDTLGKAIAIPYMSGDENEDELTVSEDYEVIEEASKPKKKAKKPAKKKKKPTVVLSSGELSNLTRLKQIATEKNTGMLKFPDGSSVKVDAITAKAIHRIHSLVSDENKIKYERMLNKDRHNFSRVAAFASGFHASTGSPEDGKKKTK